MKAQNSGFDRPESGNHDLEELLQPRDELPVDRRVLRGRVLVVLPGRRGHGPLERDRQIILRRVSDQTSRKFLRLQLRVDHLDDIADDGRGVEGP